MALKSEGQERLPDLGSSSPFDSAVGGLLLTDIMMAAVVPLPVLSADLQCIHLRTLHVFLHSGRDHCYNQMTRRLALATPVPPLTSHCQV